MRAPTAPPRSARKPRVASIAAACACLLAGASSAAAAVDLSGNAALTTDYVWRGATQTQGDPALQAGVKVSGASGVYASVWGSHVDFGPAAGADIEFDVAVGWSGQVSERVALDVNLTHYRYPSTAVDLDWTELVATATLDDAYWLQVAHSSDALGADASGTYAQAGARFPVGEAFRIEAALGHYRLEDGDRYAHAQVGGVWAFKAPFELRVTAHGTDPSAKALFPGLAGSRVEAAIQASF